MSEIVLVLVSMAEMARLHAEEVTAGIRGCPMMYAVDDAGKFYIWPLPSGQLSEMPRHSPSPGHDTVIVETGVPNHMPVIGTLYCQKNEIGPPTIWVYTKDGWKRAVEESKPA